MRNGILAVLAMLCLTAAVGCGSDSSGPSDPPDPRFASNGHEPLIGTVWKVDRIVGDESVVRTKGLSEPPRLLFEADGMMQAFTGCNTASAAIKVDDAYLRFGPVSIGQVTCRGQGGKVESALLDPLRSRVKYEFHGKGLKLIGKEFDLYLTAMNSPAGIGVPATADRLAGRTFVLEEVSGDVLTEEAPMDLNFGFRNFGVDVNCNNQIYSYEVSQGKIRGQVAMSTDMLCHGPEGRQERGFAKLIRRGAEARLTPDSLTLDFGDGVIARMSDSHEQLIGTEWRLERLKMRDGTTVFRQGERPSFEMRNDEDYYVFSTPCNDGGGPVRLGDGEISFDQPTMTTKGCDRRRMLLEDAIESMFSGTATVRFDGPDLVLTKGMREFTYTPGSGSKQSE